MERVGGDAFTGRLLVMAPLKRLHTCRGERISVVDWTRATTRVPTHRATPPPPLRVSGLLKRIDKKFTLGVGGDVVWL